MESISALFKNLKEQYKKSANLALQAFTFVLTHMAVDRISNESPTNNVAIASVIFLGIRPFLLPPFDYVTNTSEKNTFLTYGESFIKECKASVPLQIENAVFIGIWKLFLKFQYVGRLSDNDLQHLVIMLESSAAFFLLIRPFVKIFIRTIGSHLNKPWNDFFRIPTDTILQSRCDKIKSDCRESIQLLPLLGAFFCGAYGSHKLVEKENLVPAESQQLISMLITIVAFLFIIKPIMDSAQFLLAKKIREKRSSKHKLSFSDDDEIMTEESLISSDYCYRYTNAY